MHSTCVQNYGAQRVNSEIIHLCGLLYATVVRLAMSTQKPVFHRVTNHYSSQCAKWNQFNFAVYFSRNTDHQVGLGCNQRLVPLTKCQQWDVASSYGNNLPLRILSASLSGISILNSCIIISALSLSNEVVCNPYLLNSHHHLYGVQAVQSEIFNEVRLIRQLPYTANISSLGLYQISHLCGILDLE